MLKKPMSEKSEGMKLAIEKMFPGTLAAIERGDCPDCKEHVNMTDFEDTLSLREYEISGICQKCQDKIFVEPAEESDPENKWADLGGQYYDSNDERNFGDDEEED